MNQHAQTRYNAHKIRSLATVVVLTLLATACSAQSGTPSALPFQGDDVAQEIVLTVWAWEGTGHELLIDAFERENPGVRVELVFSEFVQHHDGLTEALNAGVSVPDVALIEREYAPRFQAHPEQFVDLSQFGAAELADSYLPWRWADGISDEAVIGIPTDVGGFSFAYRTDLFTEADLPADPDEVAELFETWDSFIETGERYVDARGQGTFLDSVDSVYAGVANQLEAGYVDAEGEPALDGTGARAPWDLSIRAIESGIVGPHQQFTPEWNQAIVTGDFAVIAAPSWMGTHLAATAPDTEGLWAIAPAPGVGGNWGGSQLTIPAGAAHPELAWELIDHLTNADAQIELFRRNGNFPSMPEVFNLPEIVELEDPFFTNQTVGQIYVDSLQDVPIRITAPEEREIRTVYLDALRLVLSDDLSAGGAWQVSRLEALALLEQER